MDVLDWAAVDKKDAFKLFVMELSLCQADDRKAEV